MFLDYGTITAFNRNPRVLISTINHLVFYFGLGLDDLFSRPIRGFSMTNMLFPVLYSDIWGDYWGYFTVTMGRGGLDPNYEIVKYLGRVNFVFNNSNNDNASWNCKVLLKLNTDYINKIFYTFVFSAIAFFWIGYMWFLIKYPIPSKGDTIKGTYILPLIHLLPFFGAFLLDKVKEMSTKTYNLIFFGILILILIHNIPAMITRFFWRNVNLVKAGSISIAKLFEGMFMNKLKEFNILNNKFFKYCFYLVLLLVLLLFTINMLNQYQKTSLLDESLIYFPSNFENCDLTPSSIINYYESKFSEINIYQSTKSLSIFPEIENLKCLGKVMEIKPISNSEINYVVGISPIFSKYIGNLTFISFFIFSLIFLKI